MFLPPDPNAVAIDWRCSEAVLGPRRDLFADLSRFAAIAPFWERWETPLLTLPNLASECNSPRYALTHTTRVPSNKPLAHHHGSRGHAVCRLCAGSQIGVGAPRPSQFALNFRSKPPGWHPHSRWTLKLPLSSSRPRKEDWLAFWALGIEMWLISGKDPKGLI
jgi:hypothetical protein